MKALRIFASIVALMLSTTIAFASGERTDKTSKKFYKAKEVSASSIAYCYLKATYRSINGDVHHFSNVITLNINNWSADKTEKVFSFEEYLVAKDPSRVYIASFSWISSLYVSEAEAKQARLHEMGGMTW